MSTSPAACHMRAEVGGVRTRSIIGNVLGAVLAFLYFGFIDDTGVRATFRDVVFFVVMTAAIVTVTNIVGRRFMLPPPDAPLSLLRRYALALPYRFAGMNMIGWIVAGLVFGIAWPLAQGAFATERAIRVTCGITGFAGVVTTAFIFFSVEDHSRRMLPALFPDGELSAVRRVPRLPVRARLLVIFLLTSVLPLSVLGMLWHSRANAMLGMDAPSAARMVGSANGVVLFVVAVGVVAAVGLAVFVANSVAGPLRAVRAAMEEVERGDLSGRCPVVTTDEIGAVAEGFNRMLQGLRDREFVKETFGKYVSREIRDRILAGQVALGGEAVDVTILFADLRDFTPWVEATPAAEVVRELNAYFTEMEAAIRAHGGLVVQYIGDEIEAVFGAPIPDPAHADSALRATVDMRQRLAAWNHERERAGKPPLRHGIGVHTGTVLAGNIGSAERLSWALVGDAVNLASRIEGLTGELGADVLVSGQTRSRLTGDFGLVPLPAVRVKGKAADVEVYRLA